jgi:hypothetical protein
VDTQMDAQRLAPEQARYPELKRISAGALAVWVLAFVFGEAFLDFAVSHYHSLTERFV